MTRAHQIAEALTGAQAREVALGFLIAVERLDRSSELRQFLTDLRAPLNEAERLAHTTEPAP
jgi:hypothetical protein